MAGAEQHVVSEFEKRGKPFWLPPGGWDNGLAASAWAAILDITSEPAADMVLLELRAAGVPGYAARVGPPGASGAWRLAPGSQRVRIWVGSRSYGRAEIEIARVLPSLISRMGPRVLA